MNLSSTIALTNNDVSFSGGKTAKKKKVSAQKRKREEKQAKLQKFVEREKSLNSEKSNEITQRIYDYTAMRTLAQDKNLAIPCAYSGDYFGVYDNVEILPTYEHVKPFSTEKNNDVGNLLVVEGEYNSLRKHKPLSEFIDELKAGISKRPENGKIVRVPKTDVLKNVVAQLKAYNKVAEDIKKWTVDVSKVVYKELDKPEHKEKFLKLNPYLNKD